MSHLGYRLSALIDDELDGAERDRVLVHLAKCSLCRSEAVALRTLKRRMSALGEADADAALTGRLMRLAQPGSPFGRGLAGSPAWSGLAGLGSAAMAHGGREVRVPWLVALGAGAVFLAGVGAAAFVAGAGHPAPPEVTPAVDSYMMQHDLMAGVVPAARPPTSPVPGAVPTLSAPPPTVPKKLTPYSP